MSKLEVSLTVYDKGPIVVEFVVMANSADCTFMKCISVWSQACCVSVSPVWRDAALQCSVTLSLVGIAVWLNHVVWSCLAKVSKCS